MQVESLCEFLASRGGLAMRIGEITTVGASDLRQAEAQRWHRAKPFRKRLVRDDGKGMSADHACLVAWEAGFFPAHYDRPELTELLDAIDAEMRGCPLYRPEDEERLAIMAEAERCADEGMAEIAAMDDAASSLDAETAIERLRAVNQTYDRLTNARGDVVYCYSQDYVNRRGKPGTVWYGKAYHHFETSHAWHKVYPTAALRDADASAWLKRKAK